MPEHDALQDKRPGHLWVVGIFAVVWTGFAALEYILMQQAHAPVFHEFHANQREFFLSQSPIMVFFWAFAVWSSFVGAVLLLLRSGWALPAFILGLACMIAVFGHAFLFAGAGEMLGRAGAVMASVLLTVSALLLLYTAAMLKAGRLV